MWVTLEHHADSNKRARFGSSLLLSLLAHSVAAVLLSVFIVTPAMRDATVEFVVTIEHWLPPSRPATPKKTPASASEPSPPQSQEKPSPPKPAILATTFAGTPAQIGTRDTHEPTMPPRPLDSEGRDAIAIRSVSVDAGQRGVPRGGLTPTFSALVRDVPVGREVVPVKLPEGTLSDDSPRVGREPTLSAARRGLGAENAASGSYGQGGGGAAGIHTAYRSLMQTIARGVLTATSLKELDIVFVVDATESMVDNVRGVQAYVDEFVDTLLRDGRDARFGLVTFSDTVKERPKARGMTDESLDLRNWFSRVKFEGGGELTESGLDAVMEAADGFKFRKKAQVYFIFISDAPFHDRDFDGQSVYTLDEVIAVLKSRRIIVDAVGVDYLTVKQLAWGTGGRWLAIPGSGYLEDFLPPLPVRSNAALGVLSTSRNAAQDEVLVFCRGSNRPAWVELRWRVLSPRGERIGKETIERVTLSADADRATFRPDFDLLSFRGNPGYYTVIYRIVDSQGKTSVLRRMLEYR
jgi:hypothetical protein